MIIVMRPDALQEDLNKVEEKIKSEGLSYHLSKGSIRTIVGVIGDKKIISGLQMNAFAGVEKTVHITEKYKLVSREFRPEDTIVDVNGAKVGGKHLAVMAGPCAVESREQLMEAAECVKKGGATFLRGGAFKPRTSPYDFQGLAEKGLAMLKEAGEKFDLRVVTEVVNQNDIDMISNYADVLQIGARNMQNFQLLKEVGKTHKPVLLKRGLSATISEWLNAAEYIANEGNYNIILCERGIRTYETFTRNTLDLSAVAAVKELSHLPVIADPSHGTGRWQMVRPMARAAVAAGADGLIIEVHPHPECALSDGDQSLTPKNFEATMAEVKKIAAIMGKE
ncbi:3-deoxy-7-phosphoheptulonate synthase [Pectinatus cerevisiiphilus]|uniref:3-deoxy-D-arabinoheptulosonate-7-phosphate synthase n=1 Tax=Pectinatus cerevisiiphilus TaxID=86956 RepID=A0A4V2URI1_9FIRM|nr:3-deoxy-7-phosphoheptulonate synthase [Pectinatus cerevisiiphilus]TCS77812.1 3-deoxy-D-arabinoheptulosonate-7-phosphate synthase [Pectinatus cerevisiiphilus]